jgi:hypothetical protein
MIDLKVALADLTEEADSGALAVAPPPRCTGAVGGCL